MGPANPSGHLKGINFGGNKLSRNQKEKIKLKFRKIVVKLTILGRNFSNMEKIYISRE